MLESQLMYGHEASSKIWELILLRCQPSEHALFISEGIFNYQMEHSYKIYANKLGEQNFQGSYTMWKLI